jgi:hypothetical protein
MKVLWYGSLFLYSLSTFSAEALGLSKNKMDLSKYSPYIVYYGGWDAEKIKHSHQFRMVIAHPGETEKNLSADVVRAIQVGTDGLLGTSDDVKVLVYVSLGESRQVIRGMRTLEGLGPCVRHEDGSFTYSKLGFDPWNLDETKLKLDAEGQRVWGEDGYPKVESGQDGLPDENGKWSSYFARAGDEYWQKYLQKLFRKLENFKADGYFLDTIDTASPWGPYGWMQDEMAALILKVRTWRPRSILVMNRGLFLFEKWGTPLSQAVDGVMFESYVSEWDWYRSEGMVHAWYESNRNVLESPLRSVLANSGMSILFLNYYDPLQRDAPCFNYIQARDAKGMRALYYITSPDLQNFGDPFRGQAHSEPPTQPLNYQWSGRDFRVSVGHIEGTPLLEISPNWGECQAPFVPQVELSLKDGILTLPELPSGAYDLSLTWLGQDGLGLWRHRQKVQVPAESGLDLGWPGVRLLALDSCIELDKTESNGVGSFVLEWGEKPEQLEHRQEFKELPARQMNLKNGQTLFARVAKTQAEKRGPWSRIFALTPHDCSPPASPELLSVDIKQGKCFLSYKAPSEADCAGLYLSFEQEGLGLGLPQIIPLGAQNWSFDIAEVNTKFRIHLSSFDTSNNASAAVISKWILRNK